MVRDLRSPNEIYIDLLADGATTDEITRRLDWTVGQVRNAYLKVCAKLGVRPDGD